MNLNCLFQVTWKEEIGSCNQKIKNDAYGLQVKMKEQLKQAEDYRKLYEKRLERANSLYMEVQTSLRQVKQREQELQLLVYLKKKLRSTNYFFYINLLLRLVPIALFEGLIENYIIIFTVFNNTKKNFCLFLYFLKFVIYTLYIYVCVFLA